MSKQQCEICGEMKSPQEMSKSYKHRCKECVARLTRIERKAAKQRVEHLNWKGPAMRWYLHKLIEQNFSRLPLLPCREYLVMNGLWKSMLICRRISRIRNSLIQLPVTRSVMQKHCLPKLMRKEIIANKRSSHISPDYALRNEVNLLLGQALDSLVADGSLIQRSASVNRYQAYEIPQTPCQPAL